VVVNRKAVRVVENKQSVDRVLASRIQKSSKDEILAILKGLPKHHQLRESVAGRAFRLNYNHSEGLQKLRDIAPKKLYESIDSRMAKLSESAKKREREEAIKEHRRFRREQEHQEILSPTPA
jgi:hypothetical protein